MTVQSALDMYAGTILLSAYTTRHLPFLLVFPTTKIIFLDYICVIIVKYLCIYLSYANVSYTFP